MKALIALTILFSSFTLAHNYEIPNECWEGRDARVKAEGPDFVKVNTSTRFKADQWQPIVEWMSSDTIEFWNDYEGYAGSARTNIEANAYFNMSFPSDALGMRTFWVKQNGSRMFCSFKNFYVQESPEIHSTQMSVSSGAIDVIVSYLVHEFSKASVDQNQDVVISIIARDDVYGSIHTSSKNISSLSGSQKVTLIPSIGGGIFDVRVQVSDGSFTMTKDLGFIRIPGTTTPPCPRCQPL